MNGKVVRFLTGAALVAAAAYSRPVRRWYLTWGARPDEVLRAMPGDELLQAPTMASTRAVTVDAPPSAIWPWLVQMGSGRGGAYTYDWIENLFGLGMHSAEEILPEFQSTAVGDVLPVGGGAPGLRVEILEPERVLALRSEDNAWVWIFGLYPEGATTRLVSRNRIAPPRAGIVRRVVDRLVMEPGSLVMERKMLLGIKARAERTDPAVVSAATVRRQM
ncbi:MAG TPA: SRPBCC family protein [Micromonosporaceae bacterium]|nr:SRPBCC family protein [Micromonosporaceae bacterium]